MNDLEFGWLIGILEGEGCFDMTGTPRIRVVMTDKDTIVRTAEALGGGTIRYFAGRYKRKQHWSIEVTGDLAIEWMKKVQPHMGRRRKERIQDTLTKASQRPGKSKGSAHGRSKLKEEHIPLIRYLHSEKGVSMYRLAKICGVAQNTIRRVITRDNWGHVW